MQCVHTVKIFRDYRKVWPFSRGPFFLSRGFLFSFVCLPCTDLCTGREEWAGVTFQHLLFNFEGGSWSLLRYPGCGLGQAVDVSPKITSSSVQIWEKGCLPIVLISWIFTVSSFLFRISGFVIFTFLFLEGAIIHLFFFMDSTIYLIVP